MPSRLFKHTHRCFLAGFLALVSNADALVIRDDVDDTAYRVPATAFPALADMPGEGHGTLIAPRWVVTAAHVVAAQGITHVEVNGAMRPVRRIVVHPGYKPLPESVAAAALASDDAADVMAFVASSDDLALIELETAVADVTPATLYRGDDELGRTVRQLGKGATGTGDEGETAGSPHRTLLRRIENSITGADARWISYRFDPPASALPLEGMTGSGDSGGPVLIEKGGHWQLAGLASWRYIPGSMQRIGIYGHGGYCVRLSRYAEWIDTMMAEAPDRADPEA